jgi:signal peptidase I
MPFSRWTQLNDWLRAFIIALGILILIHLFVARWVTVQSTSMYATLLPGDLLLLERWPAWTGGFKQGDIVVFRDPLKDRMSRYERPLLVKRLAGMPGDVLELRNGDLFINGAYHPAPDHATSAYLLRMLPDHSPDSLLRAISLPRSMIQPGRQFLEIPLNESLAEQLERLPEVVSAAPMSAATGTPGHIFPFSPNFPWNGDDFGPLRIPAKGDTIEITMASFPLYDRLLSRYEGRKLEASGNQLLLEGQPLERYVVGQNYYFMLGDSRHHSADSRYWGFVPQDHLVGRATLLLLSKGEQGMRNGRAFQRL